MSLGWLTESSLIPRKPKKLKIDQNFSLELEKLTSGSRNRAAHAPTSKSIVALLKRKTAATKTLEPDHVASQPECFFSEELKVDSSYTKPLKPASSPLTISYRLPACADLREAVALVKRHRKESQQRATTQAKNMKRAKLLLESEL